MQSSLPPQGLTGLGVINSPSPVSSDSLPEHDLDAGHPFGDDDGLGPAHPAHADDEGGPPLEGQAKRKSRRPPSTAERRATHNAVERARRESLNGRFMDLASTLPNMANVKRPSKSVIVAKSLEFVQAAAAREAYLQAQNDSLRLEVNELRARLGMPASAAATAASPLGPAGPVALPAVQRTRKPSSVASSNGTDSPHLSTPSSLGSFDGPSAAGFAFNAAYASAFPAAAAQTTAAAKDAGATPQPQPQGANQAGAFARAAPALDVNYLMALSLQQQQQQQNMLNMAGHQLGPHQSYAPWLLPRTASTPVAAGGDSHWLFN